MRESPWSHPMTNSERLMAAAEDFLGSLHEPEAIVVAEVNARGCRFISLGPAKDILWIAESIRHRTMDQANLKEEG